ncbi:MAG: YhgE/Pip domain-containing protein [Microbacteriaceae bacterium]
MNNPLEKIFRTTTTRRRWVGALVLAAVIVVPLAVAGVVSGALSSATTRIDAIPAVVVNNDTMVTTTTADGSSQPVLAGRQLVTELTGKKSAGFAWTISNSADAAKLLSSGQAYAVLTIPKDFSASITSISGADPRQATMSIRTDDAHGYLAGSVAQSVGSAMSGTFGKSITERYLTSLFGGMAGMGSSLGSAATGATGLSSGVAQLATGLDGLAGGAASSAAGASTLASGVGDYTSGVEQLSGGLTRLQAGAAGLSDLSGGVAGYTGGVSQLAQSFAQLNAQLRLNPTNAPLQPSLDQLEQGLTGLAGSGSTLSASTTTAVDGIQNGIAASASGADALASGGPALRSGAAELADGLGQLADGTASSAAGAHTLADGAQTMAAGLTTGAHKATEFAAGDTAATAKVVANPVGISVQRDNPISSIGAVIGMIFVPAGLWIGAIAILLVLKLAVPVALASTASTTRIVFRAMGRMMLVAVGQAVAIIILLHTALGVSWDKLPQTLAFAVLLAVVFSAFHYLLTAVFGRVGIVISLVLLALQLTASGGLYPIQLLAQPFQAISPFLPLTYAVQGMQGIVSGVGGGSVAGASALLAVGAVICVVLSLWVVARKRGAKAFGFALATA